MQDGDWFRWSYKAPLPGRDPYWCKAGIACFRSGRLVDTYWSGGSSNTSWAEGEARALLNLEFVANSADLEPSRMSRTGAYEVYRREDVVDLSHPNGGQVYVRKGAKACLSVERATYERKRDEAQRQAEYYAEQVRRIDSGEWPGPKATLWHDCAEHAEEEAE